MSADDLVGGRLHAPGPGTLINNTSLRDMKPLTLTLTLTGTMVLVSGRDEFLETVSGMTTRGPPPLGEPSFFLHFKLVAASPTWLFLRVQTCTKLHRQIKRIASPRGVHFARAFCLHCATFVEN